MEEISWRRNHGGGSMEEESWRMNLEEESWREASGAIWEASGEHLGGIWETFGRHPGASGGSWDAHGHPGGQAGPSKNRGAKSIVFYSV